MEKDHYNIPKKVILCNIPEKVSIDIYHDETEVKMDIFLFYIIVLKAMVFEICQLIYPPTRKYAFGQYYTHLYLTSLS